MLNAAATRGATIWRSYKDDVRAALVGLALLAAILFTAAGLAMLWAASTCDRFCEDRGNLRIAFIADRLDKRGLPGVSMRVSRTFDHGVPTSMFLDKAKRLRDALHAAIKAAEQAEKSENDPPAALYGSIE